MPYESPEVHNNKIFNIMHVITQSGIMEFDIQQQSYELIS